ncbi:4-hydroxyphenylpyruvate dioxygenase-like protein [Hypsibius exemplaris]|uniref:4-hydroxyphenylpyruvate dioxygenase-like protein n=1 Tax=Hypsibius exemplaris TaxID=2072580 RepID=A0A1W0X421_HYPEX|nr:4-hydroxyphenylpyruvate dioxygenase-like protein [Hypsibius exemplaris]
MATLHHLELLVKDGARFIKQIAQQYSLSLRGTRETASAHQWVLRTGSATFLVTQPKLSALDGPNPQHPALHLQREKFAHGIDTFFDIAVRVKDVDKVLANAVSAGATILQAKTRTSDLFGLCDRAMIRSCVGNVVHTLVERENYVGDFLPGFENSVRDEVPPEKASKIRHVDHITVVCERGKVDSVLEWYERVFGFSRFFMNRTETVDDGFVLDGDIGLRLKAMEYFQCAETMLANDLREEDGLKLVIAESLAGHDAQTNQVESFIEQHDGPGVQHIGLYTDDIIATASTLRDRGVSLQVPPLMYYSHLGKLKEIALSGESLSLLRDNGILLDSEADSSGTGDGRKRYLKQIFTKPIFDKKTFFMELIERQGASGFGTGNIAALWWSVQQSLNLPVSSSL